MRERKISNIVKYMEDYYAVRDDERLFRIAETGDKKLKYGHNFLRSLKKYQTEVPLKIRDSAKDFEATRNEAESIMSHEGFKIN